MYAHTYVERVYIRTKLVGRYASFDFPMLRKEGSKLQGRTDEDGSSTFT